MAPIDPRVLPGDPANKAVIAHLSDFALPPALDKLYGSWAVAHLDMARAALLLKLGAMPNMWKATQPATGAGVFEGQG